MVSTHHFAQGVKKKACHNFLDSIWGTIWFFEKKNNKICNMGSVEDQKRTCPLFSGDPFIFTFSEFSLNWRQMNLKSLWEPNGIMFLDVKSIIPKIKAFIWMQSCFIYNGTSWRMWFKWTSKCFRCVFT